MVALVKKGHFQGAGKVHDQNEDGLATIVRRLAQGLARIELRAVPTDLTNSNTNGVVSDVLKVKDFVLPVPYQATTNDAPQKAAFDTALGVVKNNLGAFAEHLNRFFGRVGLPKIDTSALTSLSFTLNTIAQATVSITAVSSGGSCVDAVTGLARLRTVRDNVAGLVHAFNRLAVAVGSDKLQGNSATEKGYAGGVVQFAAGATHYTSPLAIKFNDITATGTATTGADATTNATLNLTVVNAFFQNVADIMATIASNLIDLEAAVVSDLTDSSTGTASTSQPPVAALNAAPAAAAGAATTSAPKAGFDTELAAIASAQATLSKRTNLLLKRAGVAQNQLLTDSTGGTASATTVPALGSALAAVDGSTGTSAVDVVTATDRMTKVNANLSTLIAAVNKLCVIYGEQPITDSSGGVVSAAVPPALVAITATGTGVGSASPVTMLNTAVNTWLGANKNSIATIAAKLNLFTNSTNDVPLGVVAFDA
jgi:hypothetical protein